MLLLETDTGAYVAVEARLRDRLLTRLHAGRIDQQLAEGGSPEASVGAGLRARSLTDLRERRRLARGLDRAVATASSPTVSGARVARLNRARIVDARPQLAALREKLLAPGPVPVPAVAHTRLLLTTGSGPLYNPRSALPLRESLRRVLTQFDAS